MLATLSERRDLGDGWVFERKLDGIRALAFKDGRDVRLLSRHKLDLSRDFGGIVSALRKQRRSFVVDGEVVASLGRRSGFELLQQRGVLGDKLRISYVLFDLVNLDGEDVTALPLLERKRLLREAATPDDTIKIGTHRRGAAAALLEHACVSGWEGLIAKRADATYQHARSRDWLKLKCSLEQELVVGGFTDPKGSRVGFGALLLGTYENGALRYAGEVGTGFNTQTLNDLRRRLGRIERPNSPFADFSRPRAGVHWVEPRLVAQVAFTEWTRDGKLRHPRFLGLRTDKSPSDVVRERPS